MLKNPKVLNPEAKLQASVARDIKISHMNEHAKHQADAAAVARWELALSQKDEAAKQKRLKEQITKDSEVMKIINTTSRREKLERLFREDEIKYEEELNKKGLAFRKERI